MYPSDPINAEYDEARERRDRLEWDAMVSQEDARRQQEYAALGLPPCPVCNGEDGDPCGCKPRHIVRAHQLKAVATPNGGPLRIVLPFPWCLAESYPPRP